MIIDKRTYITVSDISFLSNSEYIADRIPGYVSAVSDEVTGKSGIPQLKNELDIDLSGHISGSFL